MPGLPPTVTYVRTLTSPKRDSSGGGSVPCIRRPVISNGVTPIHARPSKVSSGSSAGTASRSAARGTGQCANSRSRHVWPCSQGPPGSGHGRWSIRASPASCAAASALRPLAVMACSA